MSVRKCLLLSLVGVVLSVAGCGGSGGSSGSPAANLCMSQTQALASLDQAGAGQTEFILKLKETDQEQRASALQMDLSANSRGPDVSLEKINDKLMRLKVPAGADAREILSRYIQSDDIEFIEPDYQIHGDEVASDVTINNSKQWAHAVVHSQEAWRLTKGNSDVLVGVIDTGIDPNHPDLKTNVWHNPREIVNGIDDDANGYIDDVSGWNFVKNNNSPVADDTRAYHGTHVSGTIAALANSAQGTSGEAPNVKILPLKYLDSTETGYTSNAIKAIDYAIAKKVKILSNSWGSYSPSSALENAILRARAAGILFVVAAGNGDTQGRGVNLESTGFYPAAFGEDNIVTVAASNSSDLLASWSNFGITRVDVAAPGVNIYSTRNNNAYGYLSGTSMATPLVSGVAALVWAVRPDFSYKEVKQALLASVDPISSMSTKIASGGRINAYKAVTYAINYKGQTYTPPGEVSKPSQDGCR